MFYFILNQIKLGNFYNESNPPSIPETIIKYVADIFVLNTAITDKTHIKVPFNDKEKLSGIVNSWKVIHLRISSQGIEAVNTDIPRKIKTA